MAPACNQLPGIHQEPARAMSSCSLGQSGLAPIWLTSRSRIGVSSRARGRQPAAGAVPAAVHRSRAGGIAGAHSAATCAVRKPGRRSC